MHAFAIVLFLAGIFCLNMKHPSEFEGSDKMPLSQKAGIGLIILGVFLGIAGGIGD